MCFVDKRTANVTGITFHIVTDRHTKRRIHYAYTLSDKTQMSTSSSIVKSASKVHATGMANNQHTHTHMFGRCVIALYIPRRHHLLRRMSSWFTFTCVFSVLCCCTYVIRMFRMPLCTNTLTAHELYISPYSIRHGRYVTAHSTIVYPIGLFEL